MDKIEYYRKKIDEIDRGIVRIFLLRFRIVKKIARHKKTNRIKVEDKEREFHILENIKKYSGNNHKKFLTGIFEKTIRYSKKLQKKDGKQKLSS